MADQFGAFGGGAGNVQIIDGKQYVMYSPEWYAARNASKVGAATTSGTAA